MLLEAQYIDGEEGFKENEVELTGLYDEILSKMTTHEIKLVDNDDFLEFVVEGSED